MRTSNGASTLPTAASPSDRKRTVRTRVGRELARRLSKVDRTLIPWVVTIKMVVPFSANFGCVTLAMLTRYPPGI